MKLGSIIVAGVLKRESNKKAATKEDFLKEEFNLIKVILGAEIESKVEMEGIKREMEIVKRAGGSHDLIISAGLNYEEARRCRVMLRNELIHHAKMDEALNQTDYVKFFRGKLKSIKENYVFESTNDMVAAQKQLLTTGRIGHIQKKTQYLEL